MLQAINNVNLRYLRELNDISVGFYLNIVLIIIFGFYLFTFSDGIAIVDQFTSNVWYLFGVSGFISVFLGLSKKRAINYEDPGKLAGMNFI